ncbi:hypothetical protein GCM10007938_30690 [Vibrio zhanjiangensis]|uniref:Uncharacterized protein n=1 Tax=Vibrio zhanjiangensis TaxID=1046128 RepID=A0ABQ6F3L6_9VIBR|nr:hypothetical protein GCM10007938_30690 [Vibrio zhanjiangensis]
MLATKMIMAIPHIPLFTSDATPEKIVSSIRRPLVIRIDIGIKLAGKMAIADAAMYAQVA